MAAESKRFILHCSYNTEAFNSNELLNAESLRLIDCSNFTHWIHFYNYRNPEIQKVLQEQFGVHSLILEDISNNKQRSKVEEYNDHLFAVCRYFDSPFTSEKGSKQLNFIMKDNLLITIGNDNEFWIQEVVTKLQNPQSVLRRKGEDYLFYFILDLITNTYFDFLDSLSNETEQLEEEILRIQNKTTLFKIQKLKQKVNAARREILQIRDLASFMNRADVPFFEESNKYFLRDLYDHLLRAAVSADGIKEQVYLTTDLYHSLLANKMNVVMKTLTVISTIFIPLTFIVGIYGMNFEFMPELHWKYGYPLVMGFMLFITAIMIYYFYKKKWF